MKTIKDAVSHGQYRIWLSGSREYIRRTVYERDGKFYILFYDQEIEVKRRSTDYATVEAY